MGVSLERVQNKFACIIGELCSEPFILSQFAIWLDLRLAEYKAKGAISLEISGEEPDPSWLKGHKPSPPSMPSVDSGNLIPDMYDPTGGGDSKFDSVNMHMGRCDDRLSPDVVVLKDEPEESYRGSVYPVSLHGNSRIGGLQLKRTHTDSLSSGSNIHRSSMSSSPSPSKIHRPSSLSADSAPTNQSLMSIISDRDDSTQVYETPESQSSTHGTPQSKGDNFLSSYVVSDTPESSSPLPSSSNPRVPDPLASDSTAWMNQLFIDASRSSFPPGIPAVNYMYDTLASKRPKKTKTWTEEDMAQAVSLVREGKLSFRAASQRFNIPHMTIHFRVKGDGRTDRAAGYPADGQKPAD